MNTKSQNHYLRLLSMATQKTIPFCVSVELTRACNFRCRHCYHPDDPRRDTLSTPQIAALLSDLKQAGTLEIAFTGGEALRHPNWERLLHEARKLGFQVRLLTNGSLVDREVARTLKSQFVSADVSLYSMDPHTFDEITQVPGSFQKVRSGIEALVTEGVDVSIKMPVCRLNISHVDSVAEFCQAKDVRFAAYATLFPKSDGSPLSKDLSLEQDQMAAFLSGPHCFGDTSDQHEVGEDRPLCAAGVRYAFVDATGDVYACNLLPESAGNITEKSFLSIWRDAPSFRRLREIRKPDLNPCGSCQDLSICGRCHALAFLETGDLLGPSTTACHRAAALDAESKD